MAEPKFRNFRESGNVDDRRELSDAGEWARALLTALGAEMPVAPVTPLGVQAGVDDIARGHGYWLLKQAMEKQQAQQPVKVLNDRMMPARKMPFGIAG